MKAKVYMAGLSGGYSKIRVEFPREVTTRPDIKQMLVSVTEWLMLIFSSFRILQPYFRDILVHFLTTCMTCMCVSF